MAVEQYDEQGLRAAGFNDQEIEADKVQVAQHLSDAGFSGKEVHEYFGAKEPDMSAMQKYVKQNLQDQKDGQPTPVDTGGLKPPPHPAEGMLDAIKAGFQMSSSDLAWRGKMPDTVLPENADMGMRLAYQSGQLAGDLPAMVAGGVFGGAAGSVAPVVGTAIGMGAGSQALPAAIRSYYIQKIQKGEVQDFSDFWARTGAILYDATKAGIVGGATAGVGGKVASGLAETALSPLAQTGGRLGAELGTMTTVGAALDGRVPKPEEFVEGAVLLGGMHVAMGVASSHVDLLKTKLQDIYAKTGIRPAQVLEEVKTNPIAKQELLSTDPNTPNTFEKLSDPPQKNQNILLGSSHEMSPYEYSHLDVTKPFSDKTFYHGTKSEIVDISDARPTDTSSTRNLYGNGLYMTDNPRVANSYAGKNGTVHVATIPEGAKLLDLDKPLPPEAFNAIISSANGSESEKILEFSKYKDRPGNEVFRALQENHAENETPREEMHEVYQNVTTELQKAGYDGLKHEGGNKVGGMGRHNVVILFDDPYSGSMKGRVLPKTADDLDTNQRPTGSNPEMQDAKIPAHLDALHPTLSEEFSPPHNYKVEKAQEEIQSRIGEDDKKNIEFTRRTMFDKADPIKKFVDAVRDGTPIPADENPYILKRNAAGADGISEAEFKFGSIDLEGKYTGTPGLFDILKKSDDPKGLRDYALAKRAIEVEEQGKKTGMNLEAAQTFVDAKRSEFGEIQQNLVKWQNEGLDKLRDAGIITEKLHEDSMDQGKNYVPLNRVGVDGSDSRGTSSVMPIKKLVGSELQFRDPLESMIKNRIGFNRIIQQNEAAKAFVDLAFKSELGRELVTREPTKMKPITVSEYETKRFMEERGIEGDPDSFNIYRPLSEPLGKNQIQVMRDGVREVYNVDPSIAKAFKENPFDAPAYLKAASIPTQWLRVGAVDTLSFFGKHAMRDMAMAWIQTKNGLEPILGNIMGMKEYFTKSDAYKEYCASGAAMSAITEIGRDYVEKNIYALSKKTGLIDKEHNVLRTKMDLLKTIGDLTVAAGKGYIEGMHYIAKGVVTGPRIREFQLAREAGKSMTEAAFDSREVTIDNQKQGAARSLKVASMLHAFWPTRVGGLDRLYQSFADPEMRRQTATRYGIMTGIAAMAWWLNKDDERYQKAPRWEKDTYYHLPVPGALVKIPKAFLGGMLFGSTTERILNGLYTKDPDAFKGFGDALFEESLPNPLMIDAAKPVIEQYANRSMLTGGRLIPDRLTKASPEYQYTPYTSETAKQVGKMLGYIPGIKDLGPDGSKLPSPIIVQNYVRAWTGGMGMGVLSLLDKGLEKAGVGGGNVKPEMALADYPVIGAFVTRDHSATTQNTQDFYDNVKLHETAMADAQALKQSGDVKANSDFYNSSEAMEKMGLLQSAVKMVNEMHQAINMIERNPDMTPNDKRQKEDKLYDMINDTAKNGNKMMNEMRETAKKMRH